jgi:hypothetical protein
MIERQITYLRPSGLQLLSQSDAERMYACLSGAVHRRESHWEIGKAR